MHSITLRINDVENRLIKDYARANNISISELMRQSVLEKIEDEIDLALYEQAMQEHQANPQDISFEDMLVDLRFDD